MASPIAMLRAFMSELKPEPAQAMIEQAVANATSLEQFVKIVEQAPLAISIADPSATILYTNPGFTEITGYDQEEVTGCNHSLLSYKTTPIDVYQSLWRTINSGQCWQGRLINKRKDGQRYLADVMISPLMDANGKITHFMGMHRDITESHASHMRLTNQNALIKAVLNAAPVAIALLNEQGNVVLDNLAYKALATDLGKEPASQVMAILRSQLGEDAISQLQTPRFAEGQAISLNMKGRQETRWFSCRVSTLPVSDEDVDGYFSPTSSTHFILTISEHTREKRQQEQQRITELQRMTAESEMMHAMQETLHAAIHQMQGPINMIEAALAMLCNRTGACPGLEAMEHALKEGSNSVLALQNALPERPQEALQPVNVNQLVHEVSAMAAERLMARSIPLHLSLTATLPSLTGQPSRLRVAFKQVLDNAMEAIDFNKSAVREIQIHTKLQDDAIVVIFEDSGPGVAKSHKLKIFQPFYSTKPSMSSGCRGIGLSIVQQVMNEHCGTIEFKASELGGCRVVLALPRRSR